MRVGTREEHRRLSQFEVNHFEKISLTKRLWNLQITKTVWSSACFRVIQPICCQSSNRISRHLGSQCCCSLFLLLTGPDLPVNTTPLNTYTPNPDILYLHTNTLQYAHILHKDSVPYPIRCWGSQSFSSGGCVPLTPASRPDEPEGSPIFKVVLQWLQQSSPYNDQIS